MIAYTITTNESVITSPRSFHTTVSSTASQAQHCGIFRTTDVVYISNIESSNGNRTNRTSRVVKVTKINTCPEPTGGGIGCVNGTYISEGFYLFDGKATVKEQGLIGDDETNCSQTNSTTIYNIPRQTQRIIQTTVTSQINTFAPTTINMNLGSQAIGTIINNKLTIKYEPTDIIVQNITQTTTTAKTVHTTQTTWIDGYQNPTNAGDFSPGRFRNSVYTRIELDHNEGLWYPKIESFDALIDNSNIELKNIMTFKEFPATIDLKPFYSISEGAVAEAFCDNDSCNDNIPKLSTSMEYNLSSETYTKSTYQTVALTVDGYDNSVAGLNSFPMPTRTQSVDVISTETQTIIRQKTSYININTYAVYTTSLSTFKNDFGPISWGQLFNKIDTTEKSIPSVYTYIKATAGQSTTVKKTWSELFLIKISPQPTRQNYSEAKIVFINGQAIPSVTNNFGNKVIAGGLTLESINYGSYLPNVRVIFPKKYTYASSTASVLGDGIKLSINKTTSTVTSFYPFAQNGGQNLTQKVFIDYGVYGIGATPCNGGFIIAGASPDGQRTNSIQKLYLDGLHAEIEPFVSRTKYENASNQVKMPREDYFTANYPINYNRFFINKVSNFETVANYVSTKRKTNINEDFIRGIYCMRNTASTVIPLNYLNSYYYYGYSNYVQNKNWITQIVA